MNIYSAIMKAADQIQKNPQTFDFSSMHMDCGSPMCALGWIAHFGGYTEHIGGVSMWIMGTHYHSDIEFYGRLFEFEKKWTDDANSCASALRLYAAKYHKPAITGIPNSVREIFAHESVLPG